MAALQRIIGNFAGSNTTNATATQSLLGAGRRFGEVGRQVQADERIAISNAAEEAKAGRFLRTQEWAEGAPQRAVDAAENERERVRQEIIAQGDLVNQAVDADSFQMDPGNEAAMRAAPGFQNLTNMPRINDVHPRDSAMLNPAYLNGTQKQNALIQGFEQEMIANPNLWRSPTDIAARIRETARAEGIPNDRVEEMVAQGLESFKVTSATNIGHQIKMEEAKLKFAENLVKVGSGGSNSSSNGSDGTSSEDRPGLIANIDATNEYIESAGLTDSRGLIRRVIDMLPGVDPDIDQNTLETLNAATQALSGVGAAANIQALKANGVITAQGTFKQGSNPAEILQNKELMDNVVKTAKEYQAAANKKRNSGSNGTLQERTALATSILNDYQDNTNTIIAGGTPRQATIASRRKLALDYIEQQTGVSNTLPALGKGEKAFTLEDSIKVDDPVDTTAAVEDVVISEPTPTDPIFNDRMDDEPIPGPALPDSNNDNSFIDDGPDPTTGDSYTNNFYENERVNRGERVTADKIFPNADKKAVEKDTSIFGSISNLHKKNITAAEKKAVDAFNNPRRESLLGTTNPDMNDPRMKRAIQDDFRINFNEFAPNDKVLWLRANKDALTQPQRKQAEAVIERDRNNTGPSLQQILSQ